MHMWWRERREKTFYSKEKRTGQAGGHSRERSHNTAWKHVGGQKEGKCID